MRVRYARDICLALCAALFGTSATGAVAGREYFPAIETQLITSKSVKQTFKVQVMQPVQKRGAAQRRFPVVYATDGNLTFDMLKGISYLMQGAESEANVPPFILVAIGYPGESPEAGALLRARDLTFPGFPAPKSRLTAPPVEGVLLAEKDAKDFYGGADFRKFIAAELIPFIDRKYPTIPGDRTYFGHSGGGGFGLFVLLTQPDLFRNYIVSSPGLIIRDPAANTGADNEVFVLRDAWSAFLAAHRPLRGVRLYMSVGTGEQFESVYARWQLTSSFYRVAAMMHAAAIPGLELTTDVFPGETHASVWPMAFIHGIRAMFGTRKSR